MLQGREGSYVVILIPGTTDLFGLREEADLVGGIKVIRGQSQKRMARWPKTNNGDEELYWKSTALNVVLREACVL